MSRIYDVLESIDEKLGIVFADKIAAHNRREIEYKRLAKIERTAVDLDFAAMGLPARITNVLKRYFKTPAEAAAASDKQLLSCRNFGSRRLAEFRQFKDKEKTK